METEKRLIDANALKIHRMHNAGANHPLCEALLLADYLIASDIFKTPAVPGPSENDHNIMELCFRNGEQHMKKKIIAKVEDLLLHYESFRIVDLIEYLEEM